MGNDIGVTGGGSFAARQYRSSAQRNGNSADFGKFLESEEEKGKRSGTARGGESDTVREATGGTWRCIGLQEAASGTYGRDA